MKKIFIRKVFVFLCTFITCLLSTNVLAANSEQQNYRMTWKIPRSVKLGYYFAWDVAETTGDKLVDVFDLADSDIGKYLDAQIVGLTDANYTTNCFSMPHAGDSAVEIERNYSYANAMINSAVRPGTITFQVVKGDWLSGWQKIGEPYTVTVEEPIISTNAPASVNKGSSITLTSELQNTALNNELVSSVTGGTRGVHGLVYQPSFEIVEGKNLVTVGTADTSHTLTATERLTFTGTGTVKVKIKYTAQYLCGMCRNLLERHPQGVVQYYSPEKIVTINVVSDVVDEPQQEITIKAPSIGTINNAANGITVAWNKVKDASGYYVYRKAKGESAYKKIKTTSAVSFTDTSVKNGVLYSYKVYAYKGTVKSKASAVKSYLYAAKTELSTVSSTVKGKITAKWKANKKASSYQLYITTKKTPTGGKTYKSTGTKYTAKSLKSGKTYYVFVRSVIKSGGKTYYSAWSTKAKKIKVK